MRHWTTQSICSSLSFYQYIFFDILIETHHVQDCAQKLALVKTSLRFAFWSGRRVWATCVGPKNNERLKFSIFLVLHIDKSQFIYSLKTIHTSEPKVKLIIESIVYVTFQSGLLPPLAIRILHISGSQPEVVLEHSGRTVRSRNSRHPDLWIATCLGRGSARGEQFGQC